MSKIAREAALLLQTATLSDKSKALLSIQSQLVKDKHDILQSNLKDLQLARESDLSPSLVKRLDLQIPGKWESLIQGITQVDSLPDPNGLVQMTRELDDGLCLYRVACPIGVLLVIFEARPEVVVQISCLAIKSGNAVILKGGKEAQHTNAALYDSITKGLQATGVPSIPTSSVQLVSSRQEIASLLKMDEFIDLVIPRGSKSLVNYVKENTRIPVLGHADGLCSIFIDESADMDMSVSLVVDSKTNYPAACNSVETLLIHKNCSSTLVQSVAQALINKNVTLKVDESLYNDLMSLNNSKEYIQKAQPIDFESEFLDLTIAIKSVVGLEEAIRHVNSHGSKHTDCIITANQENANAFMNQVDSAGVYWNASTRFADGFRYGFGAEIGVSTNKTHARGPVGLEGLMIYKYKMIGNGHVVEPFSLGLKKFKFE